MKLSKTNSFDNCETGIDNYEDNEENIQLDISEPVPEEKPKRTAKKIQGTKVPSDTPPLKEGVVGETIGFPAPKPKKPLSEKQRENWTKCLEKLNENRMKRKAEKEEQEKQRQSDLEAKILLKAQRIKKAQERVLGPIDELKEESLQETQVSSDAPSFKKGGKGENFPLKKQRKIKKKVIIYDPDTTTDAGSDNETDSDYEPVKQKRRKSFKKQLPEIPATPSPPTQPTVRRVVNFI